MLPQNDDRVRAHSEAKQSDPTLLDKFRKENPQLVPVEWDGRGGLCEQFWHFAFLNHREYSRGMAPECCFNSRVTSCITDHRELWQDSETQDLVHIAHPYCDGTDSGFADGVGFLATRGLNSALSEASWYYPGSSSLVVVARPKTLERIRLPDVQYGHAQVDEWKSKRIVAMQRAGEQVDADRWFAKAQEAEAEGDFELAALLIVDCAHTERTGRFHRQAVQCLREAGRLLQNHYDETVLHVATRSFLTRDEVRTVFRFAGIDVPDWLQRIWRNSRRSGSWGYRMEESDNAAGWTEFYRCVVCEEWMDQDERVYGRLGAMHREEACLRTVAGIPQEASMHK